MSSVWIKELTSDLEMGQQRTLLFCFDFVVPFKQADKHVTELRSAATAAELKVVHADNSPMLQYDGKDYANGGGNKVLVTVERCKAEEAGLTPEIEKWLTEFFRLKA